MLPDERGADNELVYLDADRPPQEDVFGTLASGQSIEVHCRWPPGLSIASSMLIPLFFGSTKVSVCQMEQSLLRDYSCSHTHEVDGLEAKRSHVLDTTLKSNLL